MGKVIVETKDDKNVNIKTSLTTEEVELILKDQEKKNIDSILNKLRGILNTDKTAEELIGDIYEEIYDR